MIKITQFFPKMSKKGVTLVEVIFGVVVLSIFTLGIITALTVGNTSIAKESKEARAHAEAAQLMDAIISIVSNGDYPENAENAVLGDMITLGYIEENERDEIEVGFDMIPKDYADGNLRGWAIELNYKGAKVRGYASNTKGVFDKVNAGD